MIANAHEQIQGWLYLGPLIALCATVMVLICADVVSRLIRGRNNGIGLAGSFWISLIGTIVSSLWVVKLWIEADNNELTRGARQAIPLAELFKAYGFPMGGTGDTVYTWNAGALIVDAFGLTVALLVCGILVFTCIILQRYLKDRGIYRFEIFPLVLLSGIGMLLLGMSRDLLVTFIAIEILSLPLYVLCGMFADSKASNESSLKYFLTGAFASGFFVYGAALLYGQVGHLNYKAIQHYCISTEMSQPGALLIIGVALVGAGFAFKLALVPFHAWVPDVYQGAPTPITALMATGVKVAVFAAAARFFTEALELLSGQYWQDALMAFAVFSMIVGNLFALHQMSAKRLLAYSAIAHTGYLAVGLAAGQYYSSKSLLIYLAGYAIASIGAFTIITYLSPKGQDDIYLDEMHELSRKSPLASVALAIFLLSMGGFPLTAGFIGKLAVFSDAWRAGMWLLVVIAVLNSVVSFYYYLRFLLAMYMQPKAPGERDLELPPMPRSYKLTALTTMLLTLLLGIIPSLLYILVRACLLGIE